MARRIRQDNKPITTSGDKAPLNRTSTAKELALYLLGFFVAISTYSYAAISVLNGEWLFSASVLVGGSGLSYVCILGASRISRRKGLPQTVSAGMSRVRKTFIFLSLTVLADALMFVGGLIMTNVDGSTRELIVGIAFLTGAFSFYALCLTLTTDRGY